MQASSTATAGNNSSDPQTSLTLDPRVLATGFENNGQSTPTPGQVASLTSSNNFINFCLTVPNLPITNGQQITTGSCDPAPLGVIAATTNIPSSKFLSPTNLDTIKANTSFTVQLGINNLETGNFVNADENYFAAPQQVNSQGNIIGHSHIVIEAIDSLTSTSLTDPTKFAFFVGMNAAAVGGVLSANVTNGLPAGVYRMGSIATSENHVPALVAVAQHGLMDDVVYVSTRSSLALFCANATPLSSLSLKMANLLVATLQPALALLQPLHQPPPHQLSPPPAMPLQATRAATRVAARNRRASAGCAGSLGSDHPSPSLRLYSSLAFPRPVMLW